MATENTKLRVKKDAYFTISRFFQRRFLPLHFLHFVAVAAFVAPQSLQIFLYSLAFCAIAFFTGSSMGIWRLPFSAKSQIALCQIYLLHQLPRLNSQPNSDFQRGAQQLSHFARSLGYPYPSTLQSLNLALGGSCFAHNYGSCMSHPFLWRRRTARNISHNWLGILLLCYILCRQLFHT